MNSKKSASLISGSSENPQDVSNAAFEVKLKSSDTMTLCSKLHQRINNGK